MAGVPLYGDLVPWYSPCMSAGTEIHGRAAITFPAPHGMESVVLQDGDLVEFGRGSTCAVRFGYAPIADVGVPRVAGRLVVAAQRLFVESTDLVGRRSLEVTMHGRPPLLLGVGDGFSPAEQEFAISVHGDRQTWRLSIAVRRSSGTIGHLESEPLTSVFDLSLTPLQRRVAVAYAEPLYRGRVEPATHREVAAALSYHPNSAREALYEVWAKMFAAGVPMPDVADKRVAVAEAIHLHRLLLPSADDD